METDNKVLIDYDLLIENAIEIGRAIYEAFKRSNILVSDTWLKCTICGYNIEIHFSARFNIPTDRPPIFDDFYFYLGFDNYTRIYIRSGLLYGQRREQEHELSLSTKKYKRFVKFLVDDKQKVIDYLSTIDKDNTFIVKIG
jgi:hypothetical protein